jgi:hypothetical protein
VNLFQVLGLALLGIAAAAGAFLRVLRRAARRNPAIRLGLRMWTVCTVAVAAAGLTAVAGAPTWVPIAVCVGGLVVVVLGVLPMRRPILAVLAGHTPDPVPVVRAAVPVTYASVRAGGPVCGYDGDDDEHARRILRRNNRW